MGLTHQAHILLSLEKEGEMLNILDLWRKRRLNILRKTNAALEKQIDLQSSLNELLKEENEIQEKSS